MSSYASIALWLLSGLLVLIGIAGTIIPALPGCPLIFVGALLLGWSGDFQLIGLPSLCLLGALTLISVGVDLAASALGAKRAGASRPAIIGAFIGSVAGIFFGIVGIVLGPFVGAFTGELLATPSLSRATHVGAASWLGVLVGTAAKAAIALAMAGTIAAALLF